MKLRTEPRCPLCDQQSSSLHEFKGYTVAVCAKCDLAFNFYAADHSLSAPHLFADRYVDSITAGGGLLQRYIAYRRFRSIEGLPSGRLLEVGCGVGYFLRVASRKFAAVGLDNSPAVIERAREVAPNASLVCSESLPEDNFDVICGFHVFEHLTDPIAFARAVKARLNRNGSFYIRIPNRASSWAGVQGRKFYLEGHCSHFSPASLRKALELAGFSQINLWTDGFAGRWLTTLASPLISVGIRIVEPINRSYDSGRRSKAIEIKRAALATFHLSQLAADIAFRPVLNLLNRRERGEELVAIARA